MNQSIDFQSVATGVIQSAIGDALKEQIKQAGNVKDFAERSGVSRSALYRLFNGEPVGIDVLIAVLQSLGRSDALGMLVASPVITPVPCIGS